MSFTGKATYSAGATLPELAEDVSDIISIIGPYETPLLDYLGDPQRAASSTIHEWLEDEVQPNTDVVDHGSNPGTATTFGVANPDRFEVGDQIRVSTATEVMLVTAVDVGGGEITVTRSYGGASAQSITDGATLIILGNAALEGAERPNARFRNRTRRSNYTQIFTSTIEVSGTHMAANAIGVDDEMEYQRQEHLRELLRDLEFCLINGASPPSNPQGSGTVRRTMRGIVASITASAPGNMFFNGSGFPSGEGTSTNLLTEEQVNTAMRRIWETSGSNIDTIVVNGFQKRRVNNFITSSRGYDSNDTTFRDMVSFYESDFGVCRVVLSRAVPADSVLLLDSSRISVVPLAGRSFHFKKLASTGDSEVGQLIGEYTAEIRNPEAHGIIRLLGTS